MATLFAVCVFGQQGTTSLRGTILDKTAASITGATVTLTNTEQGVQRAVTSSDTGAYEFVSLPPGTYAIRVEATGFRAYDQKNIQLLVNNPTTLNVTMLVGSTSETVEVSAQTQTINTTDASLGVAFGENQVKQLPLESRNVGDLLSLQAGVVYTGNNPSITQGQKDTDTRSGAVNGARSDQSNVTLDGIPVNPKGGYAFQSVLPVTLDSVEEFRVTTSNAEADAGSAGGAQVALVTKSGTNTLHGSAYEYNRNSFVSANDYFLKQSELESGEPNQPQFLNRNIFGGSVGGPIKKDRLFFFANYEAYRDAEQQSALRIVPTAALRDGVVQYVCDASATCPGNTVTGLSGATYTAAAGQPGAVAGAIDGDGSGGRAAGLHGTGWARSGGDEIFQHLSAAERFQPRRRIQHGGVPVCSADLEHEELVHRKDGLQHHERRQAPRVADRVRWRPKIKGTRRFCRGKHRRRTW